MLELLQRCGDPEYAGPPPARVRGRRFRVCTRPCMSRSVQPVTRGRGDAQARGSLVLLPAACLPQTRHHLPYRPARNRLVSYRQHPGCRSSSGPKTPHGRLPTTTITTAARKACRAGSLGDGGPAFWPAPVATQRAAPSGAGGSHQSPPGRSPGTSGALLTEPTEASALLASCRDVADGNR